MVGVVVALGHKTQPKEKVLLKANTINIQLAQSRLKKVRKDQETEELTRSKWWAWELSAGWPVWDWRLIFDAVVILQIHPDQAVA